MEKKIDEILLDICIFEKKVINFDNIDNVIFQYIKILDKINNSLNKSDINNLTYLLDTVLSVYKNNYDNKNELVVNYVTDYIKGYFYSMKRILLSFYLKDYFEEKLNVDILLKDFDNDKRKLYNDKLVIKYKKELQYVRKKFALMDLFVYGKLIKKADDNLNYKGNVYKLKRIF